MPDAPPRARSDVVFRQAGDEWLLYDPEADRIHVLNLSAALIWSSLDGTRDEEALKREVEEAFALDDAEEAVRDALADFAAQGLLAR